MAERWQPRTRGRSMAFSAPVVLILALAVLGPLQHKGLLVDAHLEDGSHHDRNHREIESQSHGHRHGQNLAQGEKQGGNFAHEHEEEEVEGLGNEADHHHGSSHAHSHSHHDHEHHGESRAHSHPEGHHDDDESHVHCHDGHSHHTCSHAHHHHDHHDGEHLPGQNGLLKKRHFHSHGEEKHHLGHHDHHDSDLAQKENLTAGLWFRAMGCSLLVSLASLVCLLFLPLIVTGGKPSRKVVDGLAGFGAGCMLGDALLHQLPHAFSGYGGGHSHSHEGSDDGEHAHGHSLQDLSVGLAVLAGILLFFLVEKIVRRTEELSVADHGHSFGHGHHHHHHRGKDDEEMTQEDISGAKAEKNSDSKSGLRKRNTRMDEGSEKVDPSANVKTEAELGGEGKEGLVEQEGHTSNFVLSYLNLFSDGVHNFTDGMALGSAFLLHGTVGGWSRTLFLLAHELPQEVGDFGILLRSGFGVFEALAFNFLSALMALAGTAVALVVGGNPGHSSLIEGFTAGGFIYIAVGAVMPDMHSQGNSLRTSVSQVAALSLGMGAAILISLAE